MYRRPDELVKGPLTLGILIERNRRPVPDRTRARTQQRRFRSVDTHDPVSQVNHSAAPREAPASSAMRANANHMVQRSRRAPFLEVKDIACREASSIRCDILARIEFFGLSLNHQKSPVARCTHKSLLILSKRISYLLCVQPSQ